MTSLYRSRGVYAAQSFVAGCDGGENRDTGGENRDMDLLTIKVTAIRDAYNVAARRRVSDATTICDRCQDAREPVVAKLEIVTVEKAWTLCARCLKEMPQGLHLA
jgi:hypothetical protein